MRYLKDVICLLIIAVTFLGCKSKTDESVADISEPASQTTVPQVKEPQSEPSQTPEPAADPAAPSIDLTSDRVVVTVDGVEITEGQLNKRIAPQMAKTQQHMPESLIPKYEQEVRQTGLDDLIIESILDRKVIEQGIVVSDDEIDARVRKLNAEKNMSMKDFVEMIEATGQTLDEYVKFMRKNMGYEKLMETRFSGQNLTEEQLKEKSARYILSLKEQADIVYPPARRVK